MNLQHQLQSALGTAYTLERELGGGGMSRVFVAVEVGLGRRVVMKFVSEELAGGMSIERFRREIRLAAVLQHPHIVPVLAAGEAHDIPYFTMPFVEGESLRARLDRGGAMSVEVAISILRDVASALEYAHGKGIVHRDIKPANILLTGTAAVVTDFGVAMALQHSTVGGGGTKLTQAGMSLGTPEYMAPEQALADPDVDHHADLYAFGCVAYELLTGKSPFGGRAPMKQVAAHLTEQPSPIDAARPGLPRSLVTLVMQCLEKDPASRPDTASAVAHALEHAAADLLVMTTKSEERRSIAVLPFRNLSPDPDFEYFADGLTEEIIADLSSLSALTVISRNSAMRFKFAGRDLGVVARELDVRYLLEGSLRRSGNALRVTAQLVDTASDINLWAERFDGTLDDVFAIQERIARSIVNALRVRLSPEEERGMQQRPIEDLRAYECYLRGRHAMWSFTREGDERAIALLNRGLDLAGDNALIFGTLGMAHSFLASFGVDAAANGARAVHYAQAAFALDTDSPQGHTIMGMVALVSGDLSASAKSLRRVLEREPSNVDVMLVLANVYLCAGRTERAESLLRRCSELDPLLPLAHLMLGYLELMRGRYDEAAGQYEGDFDPEDTPIPMSVWGYAMALTAAGRNDEAFAIVDRLGPGAESDPHARMALMLRHAIRGERDDVLALLTPEFRAMAETQGYLARDIAGYYALIGHTSDALDWLGNAIRGGFYNYPYFRIFRFYDSLRSEPRFVGLMELAKAKWEEFEG
jgi:serine/threonine-protein kinase